MMQFEWLWALSLLPLPLIVRFLLPAANSVQDAALRVPFIEDFQTEQNTNTHQKKNNWLLLLAGIAWLCLIIAATRPQWLGERIEIPVSGRDLMLAVDLSGSMQVEDFSINGRTVNRLEATKHVAQEFIKKREGDRLGLILFGRNAYLQTPLTFDIQTVNILLQESAIGLAGKETAIGDAIGLAIKRLDDNSAQNSRVLILLTDGANTAGEVTPLKAAELAAEQKLKIYTIGIGADEMVRYSIFGAQRVNPSADLDEKTLTTIAEKTGGKYFRARNTDELNEIYHLLDTLEPVEQESQSFRPVTALYYWPLSIALLIAALITLFRLTGISK
ncbi:MAG: VWA domain-containing protein [Gammaproteobacteria bacterium]|nr:VWA domain-containing protein [Gammaproteobacteria bacterium]MCW9005263.1 VWA domain-containing protein [Gammaproteobacteria bacterium]